MVIINDLYLIYTNVGLHQIIIVTQTFRKQLRGAWDKVNPFRVHTEHLTSIFYEHNDTHVSAQIQHFRRVTQQKLSLSILNSEKEQAAFVP
jgi:hypothetical protein